MEMHQIRYFLKVSKTLNFTRAAEQCHVAQPSLTRAIKKLEEELGGELFRREGRRTHMTDLGNAMLPLLTQSYEFAVAAKEQAESHGKSEIAYLRLGLSDSVDIGILMPALTEIGLALPGLEFQIFRGKAEDIEKKLENGQVEVAITANEGRGWARIDHWLLFSEDFIVAINADHRLANKEDFKLKDFAGQNLLQHKHCEHASALSDLLNSQDISTGVSHELASGSDLKALLAGNFGIGIVPKSTIFGGNGTVRLPIEDVDLRRSLELLAVAGRQYSKPVTLLISLLRATDWSSYET
jgi:DNA-binding transcriptional LysR family regulator